MAGNPLDEDDEAFRTRVQERAYHLWQADGEPHGRDREYWERARELIGMEDAGATGQKPNPMTLPGADPNAPDNVEEASIQENLGEFPDRFADQGEKSATPKARARSRKASAVDEDATATAEPAKAEPDAKPAKASKSKSKA